MKFIYYSDEKYRNINCVVDIKKPFCFSYKCCWYTKKNYCKYETKYIVINPCLNTFGKLRKSVGKRIKLILKKKFEIDTMKGKDKWPDLATEIWT